MKDNSIKTQKNQLPLKKALRKIISKKDLEEVKK
jgi:hypothetical protein